MLLDYVSHVSICHNLTRILERRPEWDEISDILSKTKKKLRSMMLRMFFVPRGYMSACVSPGKPRSLQHLCRLVIRGRMSLRTLNDPDAMAEVPFPPRLKSYLTYREYDLYGDLSLTWNTFIYTRKSTGHSLKIHQNGNIISLKVLLYFICYVLYVMSWSALKRVTVTITSFMS